MKNMITCLSKNKSGFTVIELLVVIGIIGLLVSVSVVSFSVARQKSRDAQRVAYVKQINHAMELYFLHNGSYPAIITPGEPLVVNNTTYLDPVPSNPEPRDDGPCSDRDFSYTQSDDQYILNFCLGNATGNFAAGYSECMNGASCAASLPPTPAWSPSDLPGLVLWLKADSLFSTLSNDALVTTWTDSSGNNNHATGSGAARPTYKTGVLNSWPTVRFDGNDVVNFTTPLTTIRTAIFVLRYTTGYSNYAPIMGHASLYEWHGAPIGGNVVWSSYASAYVQGATAYNNGTAYAGNTVPRTVDTFQVVEFLTTGNVNGGRLGNDRGGNWFMGDYAEVIIYNTVLDTDARHEVETYIRDKYNLTIAGI